MVGKRILHPNERLVSLGEDGRYRLIRLVAEDSLGQIWEGEDTPLRAPVTIRVADQSLSHDPVRVEAFRRRLGEFNQRLAHPNVAWIHSYNDGDDGPVQFVVMENMRGQTLAQRLRHGPGLIAREGFGIAATIAEGLQAAHDLGFAHGVLTADSVMLSDDGSVKIMDFGLAELRPPSPDGPASEGPAGDVLALGSLLKEISENQLPGAGSRDLKAEPDIGVEVFRLWRSSLDQDPRLRPTAGALARGLSAVVEGRGAPPAEVATEAAPVVEPGPREPTGEATSGPPLSQDPSTQPVEPPLEASRTAADERAEADRDPDGDGRRAEDALALRGSVEDARILHQAVREAKRRARGPGGLPALWSVARARFPQGRRLLGLVGLIVLTALLVFLLARSAAQPATDQAPGTPPPVGSAPDGVTVMPDLRGLTEDEALLWLEESDLTLGRRVKVQGEPGVVMATEPGLGQPVPPGSEVTLFIGQGPSDEEAVAL